MTEEIPPPLFAESPRELWLAGRELGDEPDAEWTFPVFLDRHAASLPHGLDFAYEYLQDWTQAVGFLRQTELLAQSDHAHFLLTHRRMGLGLAVHDSFLETTDGILDYPLKGDRFRGRHQVATTAIVPSSGRIAFRNSWGEGWGQRGHGFLGQRYFEAYVEEISVTFPTWVGWSPASDQLIDRSAALFQEPSRQVFVASADVPNRIRAKTVIGRGGEKFDLRMRRVLSGSFAGLLDVVELRSDGSELLARGHLLHDMNAQEGMVMELWVPPARRRRGYGSLMLDELIGLARADRGLDGITVALFEADCSPVGEARAREFVSAHRSLSWIGKGQKRPPIRDFARGSLRGRARRR